MTPRRIQRQRTKGWRMPEGAVYVGRPTRWGNPFRVGDWWFGRQTDARETAQRFGMYAALRQRDEPEWLEALRKRDLACWCPLDQPCHADVLLVTGTMTRNLEQAARRTFDAMAEPRVVVAVGACATSGSPFPSGYASGGGAASALPVDVYVPGCPPRPESIIEGLLLAVGRLPGAPR